MRSLPYRCYSSPSPMVIFAESGLIAPRFSRRACENDYHTRRRAFSCLLVGRGNGMRAPKCVSRAGRHLYCCSRSSLFSSRPLSYPSCCQAHPTIPAGPVPEPYHHHGSRAPPADGIPSDRPSRPAPSVRPSQHRRDSGSGRDREARIQ